MTQYDLKNIGVLLYGPLWQAQLARNIGVSDRTVRRWYKGTNRIKASYEEKIKLIMLRRANSMKAFLSNLESSKIEKNPVVRT
jgi:DNA-binding XRE family transcriptional regulator